MIILEHFQSYLDDSGLGAAPAAKVWLQFLFPGNFSESKASGQVLNGGSGFPRAAIRGYYAAMAEKGTAREQQLRAFEEEAERLFSVDLQGRSIGSSSISLMGLALGVQQSQRLDIRQWFEGKIVPLVPTPLREKGLDQFLLALSRGSSELGGHLAEEYRFYLEVAFGKGETPTKGLQHYLTKMRKEKFPYHPREPFRNILTVWIMDQVLMGLGWDLVQVHKWIDRRADREARIYASSLMILSILTVAIASMWFIRPLLENQSIELIFQGVDNSFSFYGGAISAFLLIIRSILFLFPGKGWKWELGFLKAHFAERLKRNYLKRIGLK